MVRSAPSSVTPPAKCAGRKPPTPALSLSLSLLLFSCLVPHQCCPSHFPWGMTPALFSLTITPEKFCCAAFGRHHALPSPAALPTATVPAEAKDVEDPEPAVDSPRPPSSKPFMPSRHGIYGIVRYGTAWYSMVSME